MSTAAVYTRISLDEHDGAGVARQKVDCLELARREGFAVVDDTYCDNSISAYSGAQRPQFERLLADVKAGHVHTVIVWATDRLYRRMGDLERLVEDLGSVPVLAVKSGRVDLSSADGRVTARMLGAVAAHSSEKTAERVAAAARHRSMAGKSTTGRRPFGWARTEDGLRPDLTEGPALAEAYRMLLTGQNLSEIARWLTAQGFTGSKGGPITQARVSAILRAPRNGGLVAYRGEIVEAENAEGRIVDETTWRQAHRILTAPGRRTKGRPANALLSGFLTCYKCGGPVRPSSNQSRAGVRYKTYGCTKNHVSWRREDLDDVVSAKVEAWLTRNIEVLRAAVAEVPTADASDVEREAADLRAELAEADAMRTDGILSLRAYAVESARIEARLAEAEAKLVPALPSQSEAILTAPDVAVAWRSGELGSRRSVLADAVRGIKVHPKRSGLVEVDWRR